MLATTRRTLFGTDGVRGPVGDVLTPALARRLGRAAASLADARDRRALIVRDTRESGPALEAALAEGMAEAGAEVELGGVAPTPAAAIAVQRRGLALAAVISASHNPYTDNGIKFFGPDGHKLTDVQEAAIEARLDAPADAARPGAAPSAGDAASLHLEALSSRFADLDLRGLRVVLDCAHGAAFRSGPRIFRELGARVTVIGGRPTGRNINAGVGSTHPQALLTAMAAGRHDIGFTLDGDADRVLACDRAGRLVDGDDLLVLAAEHLAGAGRLPGRGVAITAMSNFGVRAALQAADIAFCETPVGDRYLMEALREQGWALGAEPSGHLIERGFAPSGDGVAGALLCLEALAGRDLAHVEPFARLPQARRDVAVAGRPDAIAAHADVGAAIAAAETGLVGRGRVLVRASGTEPLVRVMAEAPAAHEAEAVCRRIAAVVSACA